MQGFARSTSYIPTEVVFTTTGNIDNLNFSGADLIRMNNASSATIRGLVAGSPGQRVTIVSIGAGDVFLAHQNTNSTAANRLINHATSGNTPLAAGSGVATYQYDDTTDRWRLIAHEQGAWITTTYAAGDYTASAGTWTVGAGDVTTNAYRLSGRTLTVALDIINTELSATANSRVAIPLGFTATKQIAAYMRTGDDGSTAIAPAFVRVTASGTVINAFAGANGGNVTGPTTGYYVQGTISFEVN